MNKLCHVLSLAVVTAACAGNAAPSGNRQVLTDGWTLTREGAAEKFAARVPSTVAGTLYEAGYFGEGLLEGRAYEQVDKSIFDDTWTYTTTFTGKPARGQHAELVFDGLGFYADILLNGKRIDIHRLVTAAFYGPCPQGHEVLHRNGNRQDNRIENLAYGTHSENVRDTYRYGGKQQKLAAEDVEAIRFGLCTGLSMKELAGMYQISISNVSRIKTGSRYGWLKPEMLSANLAV